MKNKIGWCSMTWNPCWGCLNNCPYCYSRKIAKRFWKIIAKKEYRYWLNNALPDSDYAAEGISNFLREFNPIFLYTQFHKNLPKKPQRIFVGSMSEIYYWEECWMNAVIEKIEKYPQHIFQFLTKFPEVYSKYNFPKNCWLGATIVNNDGLYIMDFHYANRIKFISIEPILEEIDARYIEHINTGHYFNIVYQKINWVIVGSETGNRKGKVIPKREWIEDIVTCCRNNNIPIYLKDSLKDVCPEEIKEFPERELKDKEIGHG